VAADSPHVFRFEQEFKILARLDHPNILTVLDMGHADERIFYTTPLRESVSLAELAEREKRHKEEITARRRELFGDSPPRHDEEAPWQAEVPDYEALGRTVELADAFDVAMGAETRAHDFYAEALDYVDEATVVELFEWLRKAEIEHQRMLTEERRRCLGDG